MSFFELPSTDEWNNIEVNQWPSLFEELEEIFDYDVHPENSPAKSAAYLLKTTWFIDLVNRLRHARWSYVVVTSLYQKGIPDEEWRRDPGPGEWATTYFPNFTHDDHIRKAQFDYFVDIFFFKAYSSLDTLGHLLIHVFDVQLKSKPDFHQVVNALKAIRPQLYGDLTIIITSDAFKKFKRFRHGATHNESLGGINSLAERVSPNHVTFGTGSYISSLEIFDTVQTSVQLLVEIFKAIDKQISFNRQNA